MGCCETSNKNVKNPPQGPVRKENNLQNNIDIEIGLSLLAWEDNQVLENKLLSKKLPIIFESSEDEYKSLNQKLVNCTNTNYLISYKFKNKINPFKNKIENQEFLKNYKKNYIFWIERMEKEKLTAFLNFYKNKYKENEKPLIGIYSDNLNEIQKFNEELKSHNLKLQVVENHFSLLYRQSDESGILEYCKKNNIFFFADNALEGGALSGKYNSQNLMPEDSKEGKIFNPQIEKIDLLNGELQGLAKKRNAKISQIPISWTIQQNAIPIIKVNEVENNNEINELIKAGDINLEEAEMAGLERNIDMCNIDVNSSLKKEINNY